LRAIDHQRGGTLEKPVAVGADATPMSYISPRSKRQFIVISAGGAPRSTVTGDYLIAYALHSEGLTDGPGEPAARRLGIR